MIIYHSHVHYFSTPVKRLFQGRPAELKNFNIILFFQINGEIEVLKTIREIKFK